MAVYVPSKRTVMTGFFFYKEAASASRASYLLIALTAACSSTTVVTSDAPGQDGGTTFTDDNGGSSGGGSSSSSSGSSSSSSGSSGASSSGVDPAKALTPGTSTITLTAAGQSRSILLVVPSGVTTQQLPLVIALHGDGDTNTSFITGTTNLQELAATDHFVLAAPQGITQNLTVQGQTLPPLDWDPYRDVSDGNIDVPMLQALQAQLVATTSIDVKHIVVFGYSQGGYMSFRYGMDASASLACSAVMAAANPLGPQLTAAVPRKIPVSIQVGTNDSAVTQARSTKADLTAKGFPLDYHEIAGAGHVPVPGGVTVPLTYCLGQALP